MQARTVLNVLIVISIVGVVGSLIGLVYEYTREEPLTGLEEELRAEQAILKETFDDCKNKNGGEWCTKKTYIEGELYEEEGRQFDFASGIIDYDYKDRITGTSMLPLIKNKDIVYYRILEDDEELQIGKIYAYYFKNHVFVHRLVDIQGETFVFHGDNNPEGMKEFRVRMDILREAIGVCSGEECE